MGFDSKASDSWPVEGIFPLESAWVLTPKPQTAGWRDFSPGVNMGFDSIASDSWSAEGIFLLESAWVLTPKPQTAGWWRDFSPGVNMGASDSW